MKFLADESVDRPIVDRLRHDGHLVVFVTEDSPGAGDDQVLSQALISGAVLMTADKDFGELVYRRQLPHAGVLLLRLAGLSENAKCDLVANAVAHRGNDFPGAFCVLGRDELRVRRSPLG